MSDEDLYVNVPGLTRGGTDLERWSTLAEQIATRMSNATGVYRLAGGTGEMGQQFNTNYKPGEAKALQFLQMLKDVVGGYSDDTLLAAQNFEHTNEDADSSTPPQV